MLNTMEATDDYTIIYFWGLRSDHSGGSEGGDPHITWVTHDPPPLGARGTTDLSGAPQA